MSHDSKYILPSGVFKNKFGITDGEELAKQEDVYVGLRSLELVYNPIELTFDLKHLQKIHKHIFQDIYSWAGEIRDVNIYKGNSFCNCRFIESEANKLFNKLAEDNHLKGLSKTDFSKKVAYYFGEINALHPFRDGNGRTQRIFILELAKSAGYQLDFQKVSQTDMINASIEAWNGNYKPFEDMFKEITIKQNDRES